MLGTGIPWSRPLLSRQALGLLLAGTFAAFGQWPAAILFAVLAGVSVRAPSWT
jgi:hypothetical protein